MGGKIHMVVSYRRAECTQCGTTHGGKMHPDWYNKWRKNTPIMVYEMAEKYTYGDIINGSKVHKCGKAHLR